MNALVERADIFAEKEDYASASQQCEDAESLYVDASKIYPRELSLQRAHEELLWAQGRIQMAQEKHADAMPYFEDAISLNPASRHRAIRLFCMGLLKDARTLTELKVAADEPAHSPSLFDQIRACGAIATDNPASDQVELAVSIAQQLLDKAHQDAIFLRPSALKRLRASAEFRELCKHQDLSPQLDRLDPAMPSDPFE
jgi:tetratricopeptide (TPR) repeat protein